MTSNAPGTHITNLHAYSSDDRYWYRRKFSAVFYDRYMYSKTWSVAVENARYLTIQNSWFKSSWTDAQKGDVIYANWTGSNFSGISHAGVITNKGKNIYITQRTHNRKDTPLWRMRGRSSWQSRNPRMSVWIATPQQIQ